MSELTKQGISALKAGDKRSAVQLLRLALQNDPKDIDAWLWLTGAVDTVQERADCLQAVLRLDPNNQIAAQGLANLVAHGNVVIQTTSSNDIHGIQPLSNDRQKSNNKQEEVIFKDRPALGFVLILVGLLVFLFGIYDYYLVKSDSSGLLAMLFGCPIGIALLLGVIRVFAIWATSNYTMTNKKLIVEKGLFTHQRKIIPVEKIQDVGYRREFIQIIFGVGDVFVESAGERGQVILGNIHKYRERSETILSLIQKS